MRMLLAAVTCSLITHSSPCDALPLDRPLALLDAYATGILHTPHSRPCAAARPNSFASFSACFLQVTIRRENFASCFLNVFGGPFAKKSRLGARRSKRSSRRVARDSMTYRSNHQSSSSFGWAPPACRPQSIITPSRIVLPWQAVDVMARACDNGKPVRVTV